MELKNQTRIEKYITASNERSNVNCLCPTSQSGSQSKGDVVGFPDNRGYGTLL